MNKLSTLTVAIAVALIANAAADTRKPAREPPPATATIKEIQGMTGFVPAFVRAVPAALLPAWWETAKQFEMNPATALDGKTKQLIGLAVAAQIPCDYCVVYHTAAARAEGATTAEIQEAVGMAAVTRESSTLLNGLQVDKAQFKRDIERMLRRPSK